MRKRSSKTIVHVNQHVLRANTRDGTDAPVLTVKAGRSNQYAHEAIIRDANGAEVARVVYRPHAPLSCGARCWIETTGTVELVHRDDKVGEASAQDSNLPPSASCPT